MINSAELLDTALPVLLLFTDAECGACDALLPDIASWQSEHREHLLAVPIGGGRTAANRAKADSHGIAKMFVEHGAGVSRQFLATGTPAAVLVRDGNIASALAEGARAIRDLVKQTLEDSSSAVAIGHPVPALSVRDLEGKPFEVASLLGHRTVVLFWSPTCGYCEQMLCDLKRWENEAAASQLDLLVVSSGSIDQNRAQDLRSRVLLDDAFAVGDALGSNGTPSAILIDEFARVASGIRTGATEVMALLESATATAR